MTEFDYARYDRIRPIRWMGDALELLDQRHLPFNTGYVRASDSDALRYEKRMIDDWFYATVLPRERAARR